MKTIGLIGGMSWESSQVYYQLVNEAVKRTKGGFASCKCLLYSVDFAEVEKLQHENDWDRLTGLMVDAALRLEKGGADLIVLCTNTMHLCSPAMKAAVNIPFLHIAEATGEAIQKKELNSIGLLGTKFTMEKDFYKINLKDQFGIETLIPNENDREIVHSIIYKELVLGKISDHSKIEMLQIIERLKEQGAEGIVLGCTEIPLLIQQKDVSIPVFDTTTIHAEKAVELALN